VLRLSRRLGDGGARGDRGQGALRASERHRLRAGQDRRRGPAPLRGRRAAPPRDMAYDLDANQIGEGKRSGKEKLPDKGTRSAVKRVDPMRSQTGLAREQLIDGFLEFFRSRYDTRDSSYTDAELDAARELVETKFGTQEWTARVP